MLPPPLAMLPRLAAGPGARPRMRAWFARPDQPCGGEPGGIARRSVRWGAAGTPECPAGGGQSRAQTATEGRLGRRDREVLDGHGEHLDRVRPHRLLEGHLLGRAGGAHVVVQAPFLDGRLEGVGVQDLSCSPVPAAPLSVAPPQ